MRGTGIAAEADAVLTRLKFPALSAAMSKVATKLFLLVTRFNSHIRKSPSTLTLNTLLHLI